MYHFRDKATYLLKIMIFFHTLVHSTPPLADRRQNTAIPFGLVESLVGLPDSEKSVICLAI